MKLMSIVLSLVLISNSIAGTISLTPDQPTNIGALGFNDFSLSATLNNVHSSGQIYLTIGNDTEGFVTAGMEIYATNGNHGAHPLGAYMVVYNGIREFVSSYAIGLDGGNITLELSRVSGMWKLQWDGGSSPRLSIGLPMQQNTYANLDVRAAVTKVENISVNFVPEPMTLILIGCFLLGILTKRYRSNV